MCESFVVKFFTDKKDGTNIDTMAALTLQEEKILSKKVKQHPVLYDKQLKGYREKNVVSNAWNAVAKDIEFIENGESVRSSPPELFL